MDKKILSDRLLSMTVSATLEMTSRSRELKDKGYDVIALSIGEPDFNTPEPIKAAAKEAIDNNITHYPPVPGFPEVREAIAQKLKRDNGVGFKASQVVISNGAKQSIANVFLCILNEGDEVIVPAPYWVSYPSMIKMAGGKTVVVEAGIETDFKVLPGQIEEAITERTKAFLFNSPNNPTGTVYTKEEMEAIARVFEKYPDILIISDEIYEYNLFEGEHISLASFDSIKNQVAIINGVSKGYAMTGWRIGYVAAPQVIADACNKVQGQYTSGAGSVSQMAALEAISTDPKQSADLKMMVAAFKERRDLLIGLLEDIPGFVTNKPNGAFYLFPDVSYYYGKSDGTTTISNSNDLCLYLLDKAHVALVPGEAFGSPQCIRISYATSKEQITEAMSRMAAILKNLK
ncbi:MAG: aspartate aminotransferase [Bacteroidetes bacterium]|nr:MAG: aspartate aminotransferase [Bacteroidota bacterium]RLD74178.1 MAG: aspartate aminotransferase [Bacteroidota bacterium]RLD89791.1 MAG: aspartate aminotransferase [Bacteroidota bacterium]